MGFEAHSEDYKGYRIKIVQDEDVGNPRKEFDEMGRMICFHGRYNIGDEHTEDHEKDALEFRAWIERNSRRGAIFALPIWLYDHSGLVLRTGEMMGGNPFIGNAHHADWDSGLLGFIYVDKATVVKEYGKKNVTKKCIEKALKYLRGEINTYNDYLSGNVWCYDVYKVIEDENEDAIDDGEVVPDESCCGFWGDWDGEDGCLAEAKSVVDSLVAEAEKAA